MRPSGRSLASDVGEVADPRISAPVFSRLSASLSDIAWGAGNAWHLEDVVFHGMANRLSSRIWYPQVARRPKESRLLDGTSREIPAGRRAKPREALAVMCRDVTYAGGA